MDVEEARAGCPAHTSPKIVRLLVQELETEGALAREGPLLRLPGHRVQVPTGDQALVERIRALLDEAPMTPPDLKQIAEELGVQRPKLIGLMRALENGAVRRRRRARPLFRGRGRSSACAPASPKRLSGGRTMTAAAFRDQYQTSRKYAIPLLEFFDREGLTVRVGEVRQLKRPRLTETA